MVMRDLVPTHLTSEQTGSFTSLDNQEDTWSHNEKSERREDH